MWGLTHCHNITQPNLSNALSLQNVLYVVFQNKTKQKQEVDEFREVQF